MLNLQKKSAQAADAVDDKLKIELAKPNQSDSQIARLVEESDFQKAVISESLNRQIDMVAKSFDKYRPRKK